MGDTDEIEEAKKWIYGSLSGNAEITAIVGTRIYSDYVPEAPASRTYPYILYGYLGGADVDGLGTARFATLPLFQIRVVTRGRPDVSVRKVAKRIDDVLRIAVYQLSTDWYFTARREQPVNRVEQDTATGQYYTNLGGLYRLFVSDAP